MDRTECGIVPEIQQEKGLQKEAQIYINVI